MNKLKNKIRDCVYLVNILSKYKYKCLFIGLKAKKYFENIFCLLMNKLKSKIRDCAYLVNILSK